VRRFKMKIVYTIIVMIVVLFIVTFSLNNAVPVRVNYYNFVDFTISLYLIIFISFGAGLIFAGLVGIGERYRLSRRISRLNKRVKKLKTENLEVEKLPASFEGPPSGE